MGFGLGLQKKCERVLIGELEYYKPRLISHFVNSLGYQDTKRCADSRDLVHEVSGREKELC